MNIIIEDTKLKKELASIHVCDEFNKRDLKKALEWYDQMQL